MLPNIDSVLELKLIIDSSNWKLTLQTQRELYDITMWRGVRQSFLSYLHRAEITPTRGSLYAEPGLFHLQKLSLSRCLFPLLQRSEVTDDVSELGVKNAEKQKQITNGEFKATCLLWL